MYNHPNHSFVSMHLCLWFTKLLASCLHQVGFTLGVWFSLRLTSSPRAKGFPKVVSWLVTWGNCTSSELELPSDELEPEEEVLEAEPRLCVCVCVCVCVYVRVCV